MRKVIHNISFQNMSPKFHILPSEIEMKTNILLETFFLVELVSCR